MSQRNRKSQLRFFKIFIFLIPVISGAVFAFFYLQKESGSNDTSLSQIIELCSKKTQSSLTNSREYCYSAEFKKIAAKSGPIFAFKKLDELQSLDPTTKGCHWIAHGIGVGSYLKNPDSWRETVRNIDQRCNYGAQHGVVESYVSTLPSGRLEKELLPSICGDSPINDCNHIVGHIVLVDNKADIDKSLDDCTVLTDSLQNHYCNQGVFMENITSLNLIDHKLVPESYLDWGARLDELTALCKKYSDPQAMACWEEITHAGLVKYNDNAKSIFALCDQSPSAVGRQKCKTHSIGIMTANLNFNLESLKKMCLLPQALDPDFEDDCYADIVGSMLSSVPEELPKAVNFCDSLPNNYEKCFSMLHTMSKYSKYISADSIEKLCKTISFNKQNICLNSQTFSVPPSIEN